MAKTSKHDPNHISVRGLDLDHDLDHDLVLVPVIKDDRTFDLRQAQILKDLEDHLEQDMRRKQREWEQEVRRMREEFLFLYPDDGEDSGNKSSSSFVARRRGSTDVLDRKKMRTLIVADPPETGTRKFRIRFDVSGYDRKSVRVSADADRVVVRASKVDDLDPMVGRTRQFSRKVMIPKDADHTKLKSCLTSDFVLTIEAPLPPARSNRDPREAVGGPSHGDHQQEGPSSPAASIGSASQDGGGTPLSLTKEKLGVPIFREEEQSGRRRMHLVVELGTGLFSPSEVLVQAVKDNRILVRAKHEDRTQERLAKNKYCKEFELAEKIDAYSLTATLEGDGRLVVGAGVKVHGRKKSHRGAEEEDEEAGAVA